MRKQLWFPTLVVTAMVSIAMGSFIALAAYEGHSFYASAATDVRELPAPPPQALEHAENLSGAFKHASHVIGPAVVSIRSTKVIKSPSVRGSRPTPEIPEEFRRFFEDDLFERFGASPFGGEIPFGSQRGGGEMRQQGQGTGVIISEDGYIVTNNHVVDGADEVQVQLYDRRTFDAKVIGTDSKTDVAVLKIEGDDLTAAALGDSDRMEVGDWVVAVGSPFGLQSTVTAGIVSATGRANVGIVEYEDFIQTDAAINPGNSGGPLVNLRGEVVGINTAIASRSGSFAGVGFSIPINMVKSVVDDLMDDGTVQRGWLGAAIQDLNDELADSFNYDSTDGVLVGQVVPESPAERAGLQAGDIILKLDGRPQRDANGLRHQVAATKPQTRVPMVVLRDGKEQTLQVTVGLLDEGAVAKFDKTPRSEGESGSASGLGMSARTLTPELAARFGLSDSTSGVVVTDVETDGIARRGGIRPGDVIVKINGKSVDSAEQFQQLASESDLARGVRILVNSRGLQRFVLLRQQ